MDRLICPHPSPYVLEMEPGEYAFCRCGSSAKLPFCDGSHYETAYSPLLVTVAEKSKVAWCGCRQTKNMPYCDGSHKKLK